MTLNNSFQFKASLTDAVSENPFGMRIRVEWITILPILIPSNGVTIQSGSQG